MNWSTLKLATFNDVSILILVPGFLTHDILHPHNYTTTLRSTVFLFN